MATNSSKIEHQVFGLSQFFNCFAAHTAWVVGNTLLMEKSLSTQLLALWNEVTIPDLFMKMRDEQSLKNFFAIDNNRKFFKYKRLIAYDFIKEQLIYNPDDESIKKIKPTKESEMEHILILIQKLYHKFQFSNPISISLRRKKHDTFLNTCVVEYNQGGVDATDNFVIKNLKGERKIEMTQDMNEIK